MTGDSKLRSTRQHISTVGTFTAHYEPSGSALNIRLCSGQINSSSSFFCSTDRTQVVVLLARIAAETKDNIIVIHFVPVHFF